MENSTYSSQGNTPIVSKREDELEHYISFCLSQAKEYLNLAKSASLLSKPHLLFCSFSLFAKALIAAKSTTPKDEPTHGLTNRGARREEGTLLEEEVIVKEKGLFQSLHLCFANSPIKSGTRWKMKDLLGCVDGMDFPRVLSLEEPSAHLAISFLLSMICRYEPLKWAKGIEEEWIKEYLTIAEERFPSLIERELKTLCLNI
ncbi:MAG: YaaC family protein [bacterium]